jgi:hypothetical protein
MYIFQFVLEKKTKKMSWLLLTFFEFYRFENVSNTITWNFRYVYMTVFYVTRLNTS